MSIVRSRLGVAALSSCAVVALLVAGLVSNPALAAPGRPHQRTRTPAPITFGPSTVVDDQRLSGEPDIKVCGPSAGWSYGSCGLNDPYISVPWGFSTTSSFIWRSEDHGQTFKLVPSNNSTGKPTNCPGGGDTDLGLSPGRSLLSYRVNFVDLQGLTNFSTGVSTDGGKTFSCNPASVKATAVDRQWFGFYKDPKKASSVVYLDYDIVDGSLVSPGCTNGVNSAGNAFVIQNSTDGGQTFNPFTVVDCNDGIAGNIQVNQKNRHIFAIHTAYANPSTCSNAADAVVVNKSVDGGSIWKKTVVYKAPVTKTCAHDVTTGQDFAVLAIDRAGGLYAVWSQAPVNAAGALTGPSHVYYSYSPNEGKTWTPEQRVDSGLTTNVDVFPWVVAGDPGRIDIVWYGTTKSKSAGWDPGSQ